MKKLVNIEKLTKYNGPEDSPGYLLWRISTQWRSFIEEILKTFDLTHPQFVVLATTSWLTRNNKKITQADVGYAAGLDPNTTSQILRGLENKNFIKRIRSLDERSKSPQLTAMGSNRLAKALPAVEDADEQFFAVLATKEIDELKKIFQLIVGKGRE